MPGKFIGNYFIGCFITLVLSTVASAQEQTLSAADFQKDSAALELNAFQKEIGRVHDASRHVRDNLPHNEFDLRELRKLLGNDPTKISEWIQKNISWVPYSGVLKGAKGTLLSKRGNSWDRAILLHSILTLAGHDSRLTWGTVKSEFSARFLARAKTLFQEEPSEYTRVSTLRQIEASALASSGYSKDVIDSLQQRSAAFDKELLQNVEAQTNKIRSGLEKIYSDTTAKLNQKLLEKALEYHIWVEVEMGGSWQQIELFHNLSAEPETMVSEKNYGNVDDIPQSLFHTIEMNVIAEMNRGENKKSENLLTFKKNTNDWDSNNLTLSINSPAGNPKAYAAFDPDYFKNYMKASDDLRTPVLTLSNGEDIVGSSFNSSGEIFTDLDIFKSQKEKVAETASTLSALGGKSAGITQPQNPVSSLKVSVQWIQQTPAGQKNVKSRILFDGSRNDSDYVEQFKLRLTRTISAQILTGRIPNSYLLAQYVENTLRLKLPSQYLLKNIQESQELETELPQMLEKISGRLAAKPIHPLIWSVKRATQSENYYIAEANLVVIDNNYYSSDGQYNNSTVMDVIFNHITAKNQENLLDGTIKDTVLESLLFQSVSDDKNFLKTSWDKKSSINLLDSENQVAKSDYNDAIKAHFSSSINNGYQIVTSTDSKNSWWLHNPQSGILVGEMYVNGGIYGANDYIIGARIFIKSGIAAVGVGSCGMYTNLTWGQCFLCAFFAYAFGIAGLVAPPLVGLIGDVVAGACVAGAVAAR